jgi:hypothetical protein
MYPIDLAELCFDEGDDGLLWKHDGSVRLRQSKRGFPPDL